MSVFQIAALALLALLLTGNLMVVFRGQVARRVGLLWATVWIAAAVAIIWPGTTRVVAGVLGIGRGTDLVLYCFVLLVLVGFYMTYVRLRRLDANLTLLVRKLAIESATTPNRDADADPTAPAESPTKQNEPRA